MMLSSIAPDLMPNAAPATVWNDCRNMFFKNGQAQRINGDVATLSGAGSGARALQFVISNGIAYWLIVTPTLIQIHDGSVIWDVTPAGWAAIPNGATVTTTIINGLAVVNVSDRHPVWWPGTNTDCLPLPGWPAGEFCHAMRAHKNFLFAIGMVATGGNEVRWSDAAGPGVVPQTWTAAADNLAGSVNLAPLQEACLDAMSLRDDFIIYKTQSIWRASLVGGTFVFGFSTLFEEHGLAVTGALCRGPDDQHLFVSPVGDIFLTDGVSVQSILEGRAQQTFQREYSSSAVTFAVVLQRSKLAVIAVGQSAIIYDFPSGALGRRDIAQGTLCAAQGRRIDADAALSNQWDPDNAAWDTDLTAWGEVALALSNDDVLVGGGAQVFCISDPTASSFASGPVQASLSKEGIRITNNSNARVMVSRLRPDVQGNEGTELTFRLSSQESANGPVTVGPDLAFIVGQTETLDSFLTGRFMGLEVLSDAGQPWVLGNIELTTREVGQW
jgi:hypothetical protein